MGVDFFQTVRVVYPQVVLGLGRQIDIIMEISGSRVLTSKIKERYTFRKKFQTNASVKIAANVRRNIPGIMTALTRQGLKRAVDIVKCDSLNQNDQTAAPPSEKVLPPDLSSVGTGHPDEGLSTDGSFSSSNHHKSFFERNILI